MAVGGLHIEDIDFNIDAGLGRDLEELALAVGLHVQRDDARRAAAAGRTISDLEPMPMRANLMSRRFVSMKGRTRELRPGFAATRHRASDQMAARASAAARTLGRISTWASAGGGMAEAPQRAPATAPTRTGQ